MSFEKKYGLKQASREWNKKIHIVLTGINYTQSVNEPYVYIKRIKDSIVIVAVYVDDLFVFSNNKVEKHKLFDLLKKNFDVKFLGQIEKCLGIKVERDRKKGFIALTQSHYIKRLLERFGMTDVKSVSTPMDSNVKLEKSDSNADTCNTKIPYQELIRGLMYLSVCTRPDIAYASSALSQFFTAVQLVLIVRP